MPMRSLAWQHCCQFCRGGDGSGRRNLNERQEEDRGGWIGAFRWLRRNWSDDATKIWQRHVGDRARSQVAAIEGLLFIREVLREIWRSSVMARAGSLAYATLLSLIPLLVAFSQILSNYFSRIFPNFRIQLDAMLSMMLPYRSAEVTGQIQRFVENAEAASAFGALIFVVIAFRLFMAVEGTINTIWKVQGGRSYRQQIRAFTMLIFWGPLLITLSFTTSASLEHNLYLSNVIQSPFMIRIVPVLVLFIAFTMLFWLVPATRVQFRSAAISGAVTALMFEGVRYGFGLYADYLATGRLNVIYGTLGLLIIFLLALEFMWIIILTGVVMSYIHQNMEGLIRATAHQLHDEPRYDSYFALRALVEIATHYAERSDAPSGYRLAQMVNCTDAQMLRILRDLEDAKIVKEIGGDWTGWVPGGDPDGITIAEIVAVLERQTTDVPRTDAADPLDERIIELLQEHEQCRNDSLGSRTLGDLVRQIRGVPDVAPPA